MRFPFKPQFTKQGLKLAQKIIRESQRKFPNDEAAQEAWFIEQAVPIISEDDTRQLLGAALCIACIDAVDIFPDPADKNEAIEWVLETLDLDRDEGEFVEAVSKGLDMTYPQQQG